MKKHCKTNLPNRREVDNRNLKIIRESFPVFSAFKPLRIQIHRGVHAKIPMLSQREIIRAIGLHVRDSRYLSALDKGGARFDLDGSENGIVPPDHQEKARLELKRRMQKKQQARGKKDSCQKPQISSRQPTSTKLVACVFGLLDKPRRESKRECR